jgi:hypothetical protein
MKNNLVPTPIVNKNGVRTTVHRKVTTGGAHAAIPVPAIVTPTEPGEAPERRTALLDSILSRVTSEWRVSGSKSELEAFSTELLEKISVIAHDHDQQTFWLDLADKFDRNWGEETISDILKYYPRLTMSRSSRTSRIRAMDPWRGKDWFPTNPDRDEEEKITALIDTMHTIYIGLVKDFMGKNPHARNLNNSHYDQMHLHNTPEDRYTYVFGDEDFAGHLYENLEHRDRITDIIIDRCTADWDTISALLGGAEQSTLARGVL